MNETTETEVRSIDRWIAEHQLDVKWLDAEYTFELAGERYHYVYPKTIEGKILDENLELMLSDWEYNLPEVKYFCFEFGGKFYSTRTDNSLVKLEVLKYVGTALGNSGFPYLGVHGGYELCGGSREYEDWCRKAKFLGVDVLGICEKHTLAGVLKFQLACEKAKIKSVLGETLTVQDGEITYRVKLYVLDETGWSNLLRLHKLLNIDHEGKFVLQHELIQHSEGLACVYCSDTVISEDILAGYATSQFSYVWFQLDPVQYRSVNQDLAHLERLKRAMELKVELVLICDSYYLDQQDHRVKKLLQFVGQTGFEHQSENQYFKSLENVLTQISELFSTKGGDFATEVLVGALYNLSLLTRADFKIKLGQIHMPRYELTEYEREQVDTPEELFWALIQAGLKNKKLCTDLDTYLERIKVETDVIIRGGFIDYFLIIRDIISWCEEHDIMVGTGRGSIAGSVVAYLLGITKVDALEYGLIFERFLNESRIGKGLPDIDTDFESGRREEVKRYMEQRFGLTNVCSIGTFSTFKTKSAFRDLLRFGGEQPQIINYFAKMVTESDDDFTAFMREVVQSKRLKEFVSERAYAANDIELILGQARSPSVHAAGVIITPSEHEGRPMTIFDWLPCKVMDGVLVSEWDGTQLDDCGFLKADILGVDQLDKLADILRLIKQNHDLRLVLTDLPKDEKEVYDLFHEGYTQDVFQFTTEGLSNYCREAKPDSISELATLTSLYRPGSMDSGGHLDYVKIKFGRKKPEYDWGTEEITSSTLGIYVFQEQAIKIVQQVGGFSLTDGDGVRKAIGKKLPEKMATYRDKFIAGAIANGCPDYEAVKIWNKIEAFGGYSFNLSHAVAYSWIGYQCQWLKQHYPLEFWTVSLEKSKEDQVPHRIAELQRLGNLTLYGPDVNTSGAKFYTDHLSRSIYWSLSKVKQVGDSILNAIVAERQARGTFFSVEEFTKRLKGKRVNRPAVANLILTGCFDKIYNLTRPSERLLPLVELFKLSKVEVPVEYLAEDEFTWYRWQKNLCGFGHFNYLQVITQLGFDVNRYATPVDVQLTDNVEAEVVVVGLIKEAVPRNTKKGDMLKLTLDCNDEELEVVLWNTTYEPVVKLFEDCEGKGLILNGRVQHSSFSGKNNVYSMDQTRLQLF